MDSQKYEFDEKKFDHENAIINDNLILTAKYLNSEICALAEEEPTPGLLERIQKKTFLIESLLRVLLEKNSILYEAFDEMYKLGEKLHNVKNPNASRNLYTKVVE